MRLALTGTQLKIPGTSSDTFPVPSGSLESRAKNMVNFHVDSQKLLVHPPHIRSPKGKVDALIADSPCCKFSQSTHLSQSTARVLCNPPLCRSLPCEMSYVVDGFVQASTMYVPVKALLSNVPSHPCSKSSYEQETCL